MGTIHECVLFGKDIKYSGRIELLALLGKFETYIGITERTV